MASRISGIFFVQIVVASFFVPLISTAGHASREAQAVLDKMLQLGTKRGSGVESYVVQETNSFGQKSFYMFEKANEFGLTPSGSGQKTELGFRLVPPDEIQMRLAQRYGGETAKLVPKAFGVAAASAQNELFWMAQGGDDWTTIGWAEDLLFGASRVKETTLTVESGESGEANKQLSQAQSDMQSFGRMAELRETSDEQLGDLFVLEVDDLNRKHKTNDGTYSIERISLFVDQNNYVPVKLVMKGNSDLKETGIQPFVLTKLTSNYKEVAGTSLYLPFSISMEMTLSTADEKKLKEMRAQLDEYEKQMAKLSDDQKKMMQQMMGGQLEQAMKMTKGHTVGSQNTVEKICVGGIEVWASMVAEANNAPNDAVVPVGPQQCTSG